MNLSIVSGSVRRLELLQKMVLSVRATVPDGITYEIIIVGVTDDDLTADWCKAQQDIRWIAQPGLLGAIRAFDEGAWAAQGEYVILANDDIVFARGAIIRALLHLERTPTCGAVAFADDRPGPTKYNDTLGFGVQVMKAQSPAPVVYACVGMFRRWLGDLAGWWGTRDPIMREGHTYGGDTYLSARLVELGFTVDWVAECRVKDMIHDDNLREINRQAEYANPAVYHRRYPEGPKVAPAPLLGPLDEERLRVLYLPVFEPGTYYQTQRTQKRGLRDAFGKYGLVWEIDYINQPFDLLQSVKMWQPDLLFLQLHSTETIHAGLLAQVREAKPDMVIANWNGDVYSRHLLEVGMIDALRLCDVQLCVNASVLPRYEAQGIKARYWQCAAEPIDEDRLPNMPRHDVLILANDYSRQRRAFGEAAMRGLGSDYDVAIYGSGWAGKAKPPTTYDFARSCALTRNATITLGDNQWPDDYGFVSNRVFEALNAGGALLLHQQIPGVEEYTGLTPGEHYIEFTDFDDMVDKARYWLDPAQADERREIVARAQAFVRSTNSFDNRVDDLLNVILPEVLGEPVPA